MIFIYDTCGGLINVDNVVSWSIVPAINPYGDNAKDGGAWLVKADGILIKMFDYDPPNYQKGMTNEEFQKCAKEFQDGKNKAHKAAEKYLERLAAKLNATILCDSDFFNDNAEDDT